MEAFTFRHLFQIRLSPSAHRQRRAFFPLLLSIFHFLPHLSSSNLGRVPHPALQPSETPRQLPASLLQTVDQQQLAASSNLPLLRKALGRAATLRQTRTRLTANNTLSQTPTSSSAARRRTSTVRASDCPPPPLPLAHTLFPFVSPHSQNLSLSIAASPPTATAAYRNTDARHEGHLQGTPRLPPARCCRSGWGSFAQMECPAWKRPGLTIFFPPRAGSQAAEVRARGRAD